MVKTRGQDQLTGEDDPGDPPPAPPTPMELMAQMMQLMLDQSQQQQLQNRQQQEQTQRVLEQNQQLLEALSNTSPSSSRQSRVQTGNVPHLPELKGLSRPKLPAPESLTIQQFQDWKHRWTDFSNAQQLGRHSIPTQQGQLREAIDTEWRLLWEAKILDIDDSMLPEQIIDIMQAYLRGMRNPLWDRQAFHRRDQQDGEGIQHYYATLKTLDDACDHERELRCECGEELSVKCSNPLCNNDFHLHKTLQDIRIRDRMICGLENKDTQEKILAKQHKDSMIKLQDVIDTCAAAEFAAKSSSKLSGHESPSVMAASRRPSSYRKALTQSRAPSPVPSSSTTAQTQDKSDCDSCGLQHRGPRCPAQNQRCVRCNVEGHFVKMCPRCPGCSNPKHRSRQECTFWNTQCNICQEWNHSDQVCRHRFGTPQPSYRSPYSSRPPSRSPSPPPRRAPSLHSAVCQISPEELITVPMDLHGKRRRLAFLPDSGAFVNAIGTIHLPQLGKDLREAMVTPGIDAFAANGESLGPIGAIPVTFHLNGRSHQTYLQVYRDLKTPLLGKATCKALLLLSEHWPQDKIIEVQSLSTGRVRVIPAPAKVSSEVKVIHEQLTQAYPEVFNESVLPPMEGPPMRIQLMENAKPCTHFGARTIPYGWTNQVKEQLDAMVTRGIVEKVPVGTPIDWCHPMVVVPKKGSAEPRFTVDFTGLNKYVRRPAYPVRTPREVVGSIPPGMQFFTTLDARQGYWQIPLDRESIPLTTFMTPWGSYRYLRNPMGLISAGDEHNRRGDEALEGIEHMGRVVEDTILYDTDLNTHVQRVREVLERCKRHGITLNKKKFVFAQPQVDWCGFTVNQFGYSPSPHLTDALTNFPVPISKTDVRSFLGMAQQFESFSTRIAEISEPLRSMLSSKTAFVWEHPHQHAFESIIKELTSSRILAQYHPGRKKRLETDAAQTKGLGYVLYQQEPTNEWKILKCGSRSITPTESRYSASEIEMLSVIWAVHKCRIFLLGDSFDLIVDHKPLIPIINSKTLAEIDNPRLLRMKEKLASYRLTAIWRKGVNHKVVDAFSRYPTTSPDDEDISDQHENSTTGLFQLSRKDPDDGSTILQDPIFQQIQDAAQQCSEYQRLKDLIQYGPPPNIESMDEDLKPFWKTVSQLSLENGFIYFGVRLFIPKILRATVLKTLHSAHQGHTRTLRRAQQSVYWPNIANDIKNVVSSCPCCLKYLPSQPKEPLLQDDPPTLPFQKVAMDLFSHAGNEYLVMVDQLSGWICIEKCGSSANSMKIIQIMRKWFMTYGIPQTLSSDNGPQFASSEFKQFAHEWGTMHTTSSPHYPQSNGLAESAVKAAKYLVAKTTEHGNLDEKSFQLGLLELRNTPKSDGRSPAEILFGCPQRSTSPMDRSKLALSWKERIHAYDIRAKALRQRAEEYYNRAAHPLKPLSGGDVVIVQDHQTKRWTTPAVIINSHFRGRSYTLRTESGKIFRRNRRFLRPLTGADTFSPPHGEPDNSITLELPRRSNRTPKPNPKYVSTVPCTTRSCLARGVVGVRNRLPQIRSNKQKRVKWKAELVSIRWI